MPATGAGAIAIGVGADSPWPKLKDLVYARPELEEIILHALERNPARRFPSAAAMKAELDDFEKVQLVGRYQRLQSPVLWKTGLSRRTIIIGFVALNVLLLAVGLALGYWYIRNHAN